MPAVAKTLSDHGFETVEELAEAVVALASNVVEMNYGAKYEAAWGGSEQGWLFVAKGGGDDA